MNKALLLAATSAIALGAGQLSASAAKAFSHPNRYSPFHNAAVLYNQNSNDAGTDVNSQNYSSSQYNDQAADDFVVPNGQTWKVTEVNVTDVYYQGSGPPYSENVVFYKNKNGVPGDPVRNGTFTGLNGTNGPNFVLKLPGKGVRLKSGKYWLSVVANMDFYGQGKWAWEVNGSQHGNEAEWRNPKGGLSDCTTWSLVETCLNVGPDLMYTLRGRIR